MVNGRRLQCGGWGFHIGDQMSGAILGRELVRWAVEAGDGLVEGSPLTDAVVEKLGGDLDAVMDWSFRDRRPADYGALIPMFFDYFEKDDTVAKKLMAIELGYIDEYVKLVQSARRRSGWQLLAASGTEALPAARRALWRLHRHPETRAPSWGCHFSQTELRDPMNYLDRRLSTVSSRIIPVQPFDYVVFGATGDLTKRKLIPALYHRFKDGQFNDECRIIGVSRTPWSDADFQKVAKESVAEFVEKEYQDKKTIDRFASIFSYVPNDVTDPAKWGDLSKKLRNDPKIVRAFYLAIAPDLFGPTCRVCISKQKYYRRDARVVIEKPLGHDLESSKQINDEVSKIFKEDQVYRIDHYLGKETVQNLPGANRLANILFRAIWNSATYLITSSSRSAGSVSAGIARLLCDESGALRDADPEPHAAASLPRSRWSRRPQTRPMRSVTKKLKVLALAQAYHRRERLEEHRPRPVSRREF